MDIIVGGVIEKNGKFLLVQEAKKICYKKWNMPAGHLDFNESITEGAMREIKEETGCEVELTGILNISCRKLEDNIFIMIIFSTKLIKEEIKFDKEEILDVKWFDYDEIMNKMDNELRSTEYIKTSIDNYKNKLIGPIELMNVIK